MRRLVTRLAYHLTVLAGSCNGSSIWTKSGDIGIWMSVEMSAAWVEVHEIWIYNHAHRVLDGVRQKYEARVSNRYIVSGELLTWVDLGEICEKVI